MKLVTPCYSQTQFVLNTVKCFDHFNWLLTGTSISWRWIVKQWRSHDSCTNNYLQHTLMLATWTYTQIVTGQRRKWVWSSTDCIKRRSGRMNGSTSTISCVTDNLTTKSFTCQKPKQTVTVPQPSLTACLPLPWRQRTRYISQPTHMTCIQEQGQTIYMISV